MAREDAITQAERDIAAAKESKARAIAEAEQAVRDAEARLAEAKAMRSMVWPKKLSIFVGAGKWNEGVLEWAQEECGWASDSPEMKNLAYIAYEVELVYEINEKGESRLIGMWEDKNTGFGERNHQWRS